MDTLDFWNVVRYMEPLSLKDLVMSLLALAWRASELNARNYRIHAARWALVFFLGGALKSWLNCVPSEIWGEEGPLKEKTLRPQVRDTPYMYGCVRRHTYCVSIYGTHTDFCKHMYVHVYVCVYVFVFAYVFLSVYVYVV